jgi:hypothetical protein
VHYHLLLLLLRHVLMVVPMGSGYWVLHLLDQGSHHVCKVFISLGDIHVNLGDCVVLYACSLCTSLIVLNEMVAFNLEISRLSLLGRIHTGSHVSFCHLSERGLRHTLE